MPSSIMSNAEFQRRLGAATEQIRTQVNQAPDDRALASILKQLEAVAVMTERGRRPKLEERNPLDFGAIASRLLHARDPGLAQELYELASYVIYV